MGQVQTYKRKITYFYQFHNGNVGSTAGFLKLEIRGEKVKIIINIQEPPGVPYKNASLCFYHQAGDVLNAIKVDEVESVGGMLTYQTRTDWQQLFDTGRDLYTFDGVAVVYNEFHYFIGDFEDKNRKDYELVIKSPQPKVVIERKEYAEETHNRTQSISSADREDWHEEKNENYEMKTNNRVAAGDDLTPTKKEIKKAIEMSETMQQEVAKDLFEQCEDCPYHKTREEKKADIDSLEEMLQRYPKLPMYGATELFDCVRIHPRDIGKLDMRNWKLGVNSFLTHGYYTYQYLLLGRLRFGDGTQKPILGVPGVFSNREKYLANMFGFDQFIPVKQTGMKTGEFGYWIVEISG